MMKYGCQTMAAMMERLKKERKSEGKKGEEWIKLGGTEIVI
jgi:hypothetical protein